VEGTLNVVVQAILHQQTGTEIRAIEKARSAVCPCDEGPMTVRMDEFEIQTPAWAVASKSG
jgi:hypothetical protein